MLCPKCISTIDDNSVTCPMCGANIKGDAPEPVVEKTINYGGENMSLVSTNEGPKEKKDIVTPIKNFIGKYKKILLIVLAVIILAVIGVILFFSLWDFTVIKWDTKYGNYDTNLTGPSTIELKVNAYDKDEQRIFDIEFEATGGTLSPSGTKVKWTLPDKTGEYTITAKAPSGKKVTKTIKVVKVENEKTALILDPFDEELETDDNDGDTLTNKEEKELGTNKNKADTDGDGLTDNIEINQTKTDPLKADTDGDTLRDGYELDLNLDPLKTDSLGDGTNDKDRNLTYSINYEKLGVGVEITGTGELSNLTVDVLENTTFSNMDGILDQVYNFYTSGKISSAKITIKYDESEILAQGINEDNIVLYYFNEETKELEAMPTTVDKENNIITVTLNHFSKYVIGDSTKININLNTDILFILDNSVSMYTEKQMEDAGYNSSTGAVGNDSEFKRISLTNNLIDMFTGNYKFSVSEFAGSYKQLEDFTSEKQKVKDKVSSIKSSWTVSLSGTKIIDALKNGIDEFEANENNHYIMLLTDGENTSGSWYSNKKTIIDNAKAKNIKICVVGLGSKLDVDDLNEVAEATGCDFYHATDTKALDEIYSTVGADINYNYVDTDGDSKVDGMILANTGFVTARDGFSFENFISNKSEKGHCYGMAAFASLYYQNKLPLSLDPVHKKTIFKKLDESEGYDLNNTYFSQHKELYSYKTTTPGLTMYLYDTPADYRDRIEDKVWKIKKEYKENLELIGANISLKEYKGSEKGIEKYESSLLQLETDKFDENLTKDESQMLSAIWRLFVEQIDDKRTNFEVDPDKAFNELNNYFKSGVPVILNVDGTHAVNGVKLIQDINDTNKFKIEVYDNNYPGEVRYIRAERTKYSKFQLNVTAWVNEYEYTFHYDKNNDGEAEEITLGLMHLELD